MKFEPHELIHRDAIAGVQYELVYEREELAFSARVPLKPGHKLVASVTVDAVHGDSVHLLLTEERDPTEYVEGEG